LDFSINITALLKHNDAVGAGHARDILVFIAGMARSYRAVTAEHGSDVNNLSSEC